MSGVEDYKSEMNKAVIDLPDNKWHCKNCGEVATTVHWYTEYDFNTSGVRIVRQDVCTECLKNSIITQVHQEYSVVGSYSVGDIDNPATELEALERLIKKLGKSRISLGDMHNYESIHKPLGNAESNLMNRSDSYGVKVMVKNPSCCINQPGTN